MKSPQICFVISLVISLLSCDDNYKTVTINTPTIQCGMCDMNIKQGLKKIDGIAKSTSDWMGDESERKTVVVYDSEKLDLKTIEETISNLGYQANSKLANTVAYEKLPACCKIGGMDKL